MDTATIVTALIVAILGGGGLGAIAQRWWDYKLKSRSQDYEHEKSERESENAVFRAQLAWLEGATSECLENRLADTVAHAKEIAELNREIGGLREAVRRLESSKHVAFISCGDDGKIIDWNQGATAIFGYTAAEIVGKDVEILIPDRFRARHHQAFSAARSDEREQTAATEIRDGFGLHRSHMELPITIKLHRIQLNGKRLFQAEITQRI